MTHSDNNLNIESISEGEIFKNYKHLCTTLGDKVKTGKSKQLQLKDWERYFTYTKDGHRFIITDIKETPTEKIDNRGGARNFLPHASEMESVFFYVLSKESNYLFLSPFQLLLKLNMININFSYANINQNKAATYLEIDRPFVYEFFDITKRTLKHNLESMLNRLQDKGCIKYKPILTVNVATAITETNKLGDIKVKTEITRDDYDNEHINLSTNIETEMIHRPATHEEIILIETMESFVMDEYFNCKSKQELISKELWNSYTKKVNERLLEEANIKFYYTSYEIESDNLNEIKLIDYNEYITNINKLNLSVRSQLLSNITRRQLDVVKGKCNTNVKVRSDKQFIKNEAKLVNIFINRQYEDIRDYIKNTKPA